GDVLVHARVHVGALEGVEIEPVARDLVTDGTRNAEEQGASGQRAGENEGQRSRRHARSTPGAAVAGPSRAGARGGRGSSWLCRVAFASRATGSHHDPAPDLELRGSDCSIGSPTRVAGPRLSRRSPRSWSGMGTSCRAGISRKASRWTAGASRSW